MTTPNSTGNAPTEVERLAALRCLRLLDTQPSESVDRITELAAYVLDVPIALVSLIDASRQWFKARVGLDVAETSRDIAFCAHAVDERRLVHVADATQDPRFAENPMVVGTPFIRAYLGIPIYSRAGHALGTLCAIDVRPREFSDKDVQALSQLAKVLEESLHARELAAATDERLRAKNRELQTHIRKVLNSERSLRVVEHRLRSITNNVPAMIGYWNRDLQCEFANNAYQELFRLQAKWTIGTSMRALLGDGHFSSIEPHAQLALCGSRSISYGAPSSPTGPLYSSRSGSFPMSKRLRLQT